MLAAWQQEEGSAGRREVGAENDEGCEITSLEALLPQTSPAWRLRLSLDRGLGWWGGSRQGREWGCAEAKLPCCEQNPGVKLVWVGE